MEGPLSRIQTLDSSEIYICQKGHQNLVNSDTSNEYVKQFASPDALKREWSALQECSGKLIQRVVGVDWEQLHLRLEFDQNAIPLSEFGSEELPLFVSLLPAIVSAIRHCHQKGWVHGDIKPSNILYVPDLKQIRLIDFGASYRTGTSREALNDWQVTPMFAMPERLSGEGLVETGDDWFSLIKIIDQVMPLAHDHSLLPVLEQVHTSLIAGARYKESL